MRGPKMLVVDWDFFFPNPTFSAQPPHPEAEWMLYEWQHRENPFFTDSELLWGGRAQGFLQNGLELPRAQGWETFWDRFQWSEDGVSFVYGDSNLHAGRLMPSTFGMTEDWGFDDVWDVVSLYDAHHDCGYKSTGSYKRWEATGLLTCEDWMLNHHRAGSRLEVTYPAWRVEVGKVEPEPLVPVDRRVDDGTTPDHVYDAVYLCRSGAWVPPWCDDQFSAFLEAFPGPLSKHLMDGDTFVHPRPDPVPEARRSIELMAQANAKWAEMEGERA